MRAPLHVDQIALDTQWRYSHPFPPLGFVPFADGALGNGDTFGLYWPIGREREEPLVAETWHDEWRVQPTYSSLERFLLAWGRRDEDDLPEPLTLEEDPASPRTCLERARERVSAGDLEGACALLERAVAVLPEFTDALSALWSVYVRTRRPELAAPVAIRAIISPRCFGLRAVKPLRWLRSADVPAPLRADPIWKRREGLSLEFGGAKHNEDYPLLLGAIEEYLDQSQYEPALTLMQTYAEFMASETTAFQERCQFNREAFLQRQIEVSAKLPGGARNVF